MFPLSNRPHRCKEERAREKAVVNSEDILEMLLGHLFSPFVARDGLLIAHDAIRMQKYSLYWAY